jgi:hypothetical protein
VDLDPPTADADLLHDESQEALAALEVEVIERGGDTFGEAGDAAPQSVLLGELDLALA